MSGRGPLPSLRRVPTGPPPPYRNRRRPPVPHPHGANGSTVNTNDLTSAELRLLVYFVQVARQVIPKNHPAAKHTATMLRRLDARIGVARERNPETPSNGKLKHGTTISTSEAAALLGISQRRVQQRIAAGEIPARRVGRTFIIDSDAITE